MKTFMSYLLLFALILGLISNVSADPTKALNQILALQKQGIEMLKKVKTLNQLKSTFNEMTNHYEKILVLTHKVLTDALKMNAAKQKEFLEMNKKMQMDNQSLQQEMIRETKRIEAIAGAKAEMEKFKQGAKDNPKLKKLTEEIMGMFMKLSQNANPQQGQQGGR